MRMIEKVARAIQGAEATHAASGLPWIEHVASEAIMAMREHNIEIRNALSMVVEYDNLLRRFTGPIEDITASQNAAIDAAYDEMVFAARAALPEFIKRDT